MGENAIQPGAPGGEKVREFHPVANLFPLLAGPAFDELVEDIRKNGLLEPIKEDSQGRIVDGRNRYRACLQAGIEPRFVPCKDDELLELALSLNLRRRHLNESQRAMVAARLARLMETEAVKRKGRRTDLAANLRPGQRQRSSAEAAVLVNVSSRLVESAMKVLQRGCNELIAEVDSGALAVSSAAALAGLPEEQQGQVMAGGAKEVARKVRELRLAKSKTESPCPSPGYFGVVGVQISGPRVADNPGQGRVVFLWVGADGLDAAVDALRGRGFRDAPMSPHP